MRRITGNVSGPDPQQFLLTAGSRAMEKVASEIDYALLEATSKHPKGPDAATFNFYGSVGVVQTGAGATATVTNTADQRQAIIGALNAVQEAAARAPELAAPQRAPCHQSRGEPAHEFL